MTYDDAKFITDLVERARLANNTCGQIPEDALAKERGITRGAAMTLHRQAKDILTHGPVCPHCNGSGRDRGVPFQLPPVLIPGVTRR